jgi:CheY-like chemotaxis protein
MADATIHVLLVEDSPIDARLLREVLEGVAPGRFVVTHTERLNEALQCLKEARFDVLLLDLGCQTVKDCRPSPRYTPRPPPCQL